jgi:hypothetical protein
MPGRQYWVIGQAEADARDTGDRLPLGPFPTREQAVEALDRLAGATAGGRFSVIASAHNPARRNVLAALGAYRSVPG